ncbi:recombinase RecT [Rhizobium favelukesii]|uniref:recombinase RecT n=1 Tax=Rhizobium favelukesii TaxID=348824 RepID=UPI00215E54E2|nr:recombinase RecT [Rhizobium favelukesii]MCS0459495.1 recombinase RecT [Rhizobium favelukesii]
MNAHAPEVSRLPAIAGGGNVMAIIPQTFEDTWRIARAVFVAGLAPEALVKGKDGDDAISAVAVSIMSGAELGLKPMVSLRSFTVINGKPALYGDGLINVVRQSGKVSYLRTGCDEVNGQLVGWCEAKRSDTGEDKRVEFSQSDAVRAGLWPTSATVRRKVWENNQQVWKDVPNDTPWARFPQRMLAWRAAGYCLRELFGDVLGGIRDEYEAREIADVEDMRDVTPPAVAENKPTPPKPPKPPAPPAAKTIEAEPQDKPVETAEFVLGDFLSEIETAMTSAKDEADLEEIWNDFDAPAVLETEGHSDMIEAAFSIKTRRLAQLSPLNGG